MKEMIPSASKRYVYEKPPTMYVTPNRHAVRKASPPKVYTPVRHTTVVSPKQVQFADSGI